MKNKALILALILAISLTLPIIAKNTGAVTVPQNGLSSNNIKWITAGYNFYKDPNKGFIEQPEFLMLTVDGGVPVITNTTVIIQGLDALGAPVAGLVHLNGTSDNPILANTHPYPVVDPHSGLPVAFSNITNVLQQNGTDGNKFLISTMPEDYSTVNPNGYQQYLGSYDPASGWKPGVYDYNGLSIPPYTYPIGPYLVSHGNGTTPTVQNVAFQPATAEAITVYINWLDINHDLEPDGYQAFPVAGTDSFGTAAGTTIYVEGLNAKGEKIILSHTFGASESSYTWDCLCEIDKVWGSVQGYSYYFFTSPPVQHPLFEYYVLLDHMTISPDSYDILAYNGVDTPTTLQFAPGSTNITVALRDVDGNLVNWGGDKITQYGGVLTNYTHGTDIVLSFWTSGGTIEPSYDVYIKEEHDTAQVNITADTNARTIKVVCDANVPGLDATGVHFHDQLNMYVWTEMTFDGVSLTQSPTASTDWPLHILQWGYYTDAGMYGTFDANGLFHPDFHYTAGPFTGNVPPKPVLPTELNGPAANGIKFDGPIYEVSIPLYVGCNLISSPVYPLMKGYYRGYPASLPTAGTGLPAISINGNTGIPMDHIFNYTSARNSIEAIWWVTYPDGTPLWHVYVPGVTLGDSESYFKDGVGYWIKAEKPATLEFSGIAMENGPFMPQTYELEAHSWNLVGVTTVTGFPHISDYLESTNTGPLATLQAVGPVWVYYAKFQMWVRNPTWGLWPGEAFWVFNKLDTNVYIAP
jgi:hypothetical protein